MLLRRQHTTCCCMVCSYNSALLASTFLVHKHRFESTSPQLSSKQLAHTARLYDPSYSFLRVLLRAPRVSCVLPAARVACVLLAHTACTLARLPCQGCTNLNVEFVVAQVEGGIDGLEGLEIDCHLKRFRPRVTSTSALASCMLHTCSCAARF